MEQVDSDIDKVEKGDSNGVAKRIRGCLKSPGCFLAAFITISCAVIAGLILHYLIYGDIPYILKTHGLGIVSEAYLKDIEHSEPENFVWTKINGELCYVAFNDNVLDLSGQNKYNNCVRGCVAKGTEGSITFNLDGKYKRFDGELILTYDSRGAHGTLGVTFYLDGNRIENASGIKLSQDGVRQKKIEDINVKGAKKLKIELSGKGSEELPPALCLAEAKLTS